MRRGIEAQRRKYDAANIRANIDPREFYRHELRAMPRDGRLSGSGWTDGGLCPFHNDRHKGNFRINLDSGAFVCFACGAKGQDVIAFVQERDGLTFLDALSTLADAWGVRP